jgi:hypothetical protein
MKDSISEVNITIDKSRIPKKLTFSGLKTQSKFKLKFINFAFSRSEKFGLQKQIWGHFLMKFAKIERIYKINTNSM